MTTALQTKRIGSGRPVERLGRRCPPIDDDRVLGSIPHADPADIERVVVLATVIDATKDQRGIANVELLQSIDDVLGERLSLKSRLIGAARANFER